MNRPQLPYKLKVVLLTIGIAITFRAFYVANVDFTPTDLTLYAQYGFVFEKSRKHGKSPYDLYSELANTNFSVRTGEGREKLEYPPIALSWMHLPIYFMSQETRNASTFSQEFIKAYRKAYRQLNFIVEFLMLVLIWTVFRSVNAIYCSRKFLSALAVYLAATGILYFLLYERLDLILGLLLLLALALLVSRHHYIWSFVVLAIAINFKVIPILWAPIFVVASLPSSILNLANPLLHIKQVLSRALILSALTLIIPVLYYAKYGPKVFDFISYHGARGLQIEAMMASIAMFLEPLGIKIFVTSGYGSVNLGGGLPDFFASISNYLIILFCTISFFSFLFFIYCRRHENSTGNINANVAVRFPRETIMILTLVLLIALTFAKVFSAQYLLWLFPVLITCLYVSGQSAPAHICIVFVISILTTIIYPTIYFESIFRPSFIENALLSGDSPAPEGALILIFRNFLIIFIMVKIFSFLRNLTVDRPIQPFFFRAGLTSFMQSHLVLVFMIIMAIPLTFYGLGNHFFWDDEANTALFAQSVWESGDTDAKRDHNIVAYGDGLELKDFKNRYLPPLGYYVAAPFVGIFPTSTTAARLPFALIGFLSLVVLAQWLRKEGASPQFCLIAAIGILCSAAFFLYIRQSRYFALSIFFSIVALYSYWYLEEKPVRNIFLLSVCLLGLLASHYINFLSLFVALCLDALCWRHHIIRRYWKQLLVYGLPCALLGLMIVLTWNPLGSEAPIERTGLNWNSYFALFFQALLEMGQSAHGVLLLLSLSPLIAIYSNRTWLIRIILGFLIYIIVMIPFLPDPKLTGDIGFSSLRYLAPLVLPLVVLSAYVLYVLIPSKSLIGLSLISLAVFGTGLVSHLRVDHSYIISYSSELRQNRSNAYKQTIEWLKEYIDEPSSIAVFPTYATYPLMYYLPQHVYAWQFSASLKGSFKDLEAIHFRGVTYPDYLVSFGSHDILLNDQPLPYELVASIPVYWKDDARPELHWRSFTIVREFDRMREGVYIYQRVD